jgi:hypothetical protein
MNPQLQEKILAVTHCGVDAAESTGFFRVALGLYYLSGLMTKETLDFKKIDRDFNRFIYHTIGKGHSITSILQYMSGEKVVPVVESKRFLPPLPSTAPKCRSKTSLPAGPEPGRGEGYFRIDVRGPVADYIERQRQLREAADAG